MLPQRKARAVNPVVTRSIGTSCKAQTPVSAGSDVEAMGFARNLAALRGSSQAIEFLNHALSHLLAQQHDPVVTELGPTAELKDLPFELFEHTLEQIVPREGLFRDAARDAESIEDTHVLALAASVTSAAYQLHSAASVCLRWRYAAIRAFDALKYYALVLAMPESPITKKLHDTATIDRMKSHMDITKDMMTVLVSINNHDEWCRRWFETHGTGWELRNQLYVHDERFLERAREAATLKAVTSRRRSLQSASEFRGALPF